MNENEKKFINGLSTSQKRSWVGDRLEKSTKEERTAIVDDLSLMENRRFLLPLNAELRKNLDRLQQGIYELKEKHKEFISFGLYGSYTRGYANSGSDIDGLVFIDYDKAIAAMDSKLPITQMDFLSEEDRKLILKIINGRQSTEPLSQDSEDIKDPEFIILAAKYRKIFHDALLNQGLIFEKAGIGFIDKNLITETINHPNLTTDDLDNIAPIFFIAVGGRDIDLYRRIIVDELKKQGSRGEMAWTQIMTRLYYQLETNAEEEGDPKYLERFQKLYPKLNEAYKYFRLESK